MNNLNYDTIKKVISDLISEAANDYNDKRVFDTVEAAEYLDMGAEWLKKTRRTGVINGTTPSPTYIKVGSSVKYLKDDLDKFLNCLPKYQHSAQEQPF